jgi:hypothetical protein
VDDALLVRRLERFGDLAGDGESLVERRARASAARRGFALDSSMTRARTPLDSSRP